jgi:hypothetical protein
MGNSSTKRNDFERFLNYGSKRPPTDVSTLLHIARKRDIRSSLRSSRQYCSCSSTMVVQRPAQLRITARTQPRSRRLR